MEFKFWKLLGNGSLGVAGKRCYVWAFCDHTHSTFSVCLENQVNTCPTKSQYSFKFKFCMMNCSGAGLYLLHWWLGETCLLHWRSSCFRQLFISCPCSPIAKLQEIELIKRSSRTDQKDLSVIPVCQGFLLVQTEELIQSPALMSPWFDGTSCRQH